MEIVTATVTALLIEAAILLAAALIYKGVKWLVVRLDCQEEFEALTV